MAENAFVYEEAGLSIDGVPLEEIAREVAPPFYVYGGNSLDSRFRSLDEAFSRDRALHCVALKANSQPALLRPLADAGAGAEVVSGAELLLALRLGIDPGRIVFSGVGKTDRELLAGIDADILMFLVESEAELGVLDGLAGSRGRRVRVALRLNPDIDPKTHRHIATGVSTAKFGIDPDEARRLYERHREFSHLEFVGVHSHIGSQITSLEPLAENARVLATWVRTLHDIGVPIRYVDIGGGLGISYEGGEAPDFASYAAEVSRHFTGLDVRIVTEPGRSLFGPIGALVVQIVYKKKVHGRDFAVVNAGLNDLLRPALYDAFHRVLPLLPGSGETSVMDIAGAVCESSDIFARDRELPSLARGDRLAILDAGAYGFAMSSNYNLRPRASEVVVRDGGYAVVRKSESDEWLVARELGTS